GALAITGPAGAPTATLATLADPAVLAATTPASAARLALYPNPAHETATVPLPTGASGAVQVLDALGREVRQQPVAAGAAEVQFDLRGLAPGLYLVRVPGAGGTPAQHLVID
ncbi:MAG: T9SS type A sorting domain-containing protein, partial [Hymenobacter sp.]